MLSKKMNSQEIAQTLEMSRSLVDEYIKNKNEVNTEV
jgi:predicted transcriptional regulator